MLSQRRELFHYHSTYELLGHSAVESFRLDEKQRIKLLARTHVASLMIGLLCSLAALGSNDEIADGYRIGIYVFAMCVGLVLGVNIGVYQDSAKIRHNEWRAVWRMRTLVGSIAISAYLIFLIIFLDKFPVQWDTWDQDGFFALMRLPILIWCAESVIVRRTFVRQLQEHTKPDATNDEHIMSGTSAAI